MAKGKKKQQTNGVAVEDVVAEALSPDAPVIATIDTSEPPATTTATTTTATPAATGPPAAARTEPGEHGLVDSAVDTVSDVARFVNSVVPQRLPAYLGGAALLVLGLVDPPLVLGGVLAYEAIRRWGPAPRG